MKVKRISLSTKRLVLASLLTAIIVVIQVLAVLTRAFLPLFSLNLVLIPIVIGAATGGIGVGAWLGFVSGVAVLLSGDADPFLAVSIGGTLATVLLKGLASGLASAIVYKLLENKNKYLAVICAALACPIANTGVFLLGSFIFFMDTLKSWAVSTEYPNVFAYIFLGMIGINFIIEVVINIVLSPTIVRILDIKKK